MLGRKREAMITLWCLSELIVVDSVAEDGGEGEGSPRRVFEEAIALIGDVTCSAGLCFHRVRPRWAPVSPPPTTERRRIPALARPL